MTNLNDGLVLHLPMKEGSGTKVLDRSRQQNHGILSGAVFVEPFESESEGAWIKADWNQPTTKRMKITIDSSVVDSDETDFPVTLTSAQQQALEMWTLVQYLMSWLLKALSLLWQHLVEYNAM